MTATRAEAGNFTAHVASTPDGGFAISFSLRYSTIRNGISRISFSPEGEPLRMTVIIDGTTRNAAIDSQLPDDLAFDLQLMLELAEIIITILHNEPARLPYVLGI